MQCSENFIYCHTEENQHYLYSLKNNYEFHEGRYTTSLINDTDLSEFDIQSLNIVNNCIILYNKKNNKYMIKFPYKTKFDIYGSSLQYDDDSFKNQNYNQNVNKIGGSGYKLLLSKDGTCCINKISDVIMKNILDCYCVEDCFVLKSDAFNYYMFVRDNESISKNPSAEFEISEF